MGVIFLVVMGTQVDTAEVEKCKAVQKSYTECTIKAHDDYKAIMRAGDDGNKDFNARKACNYITDGVQGCGEKLLEGDCNSAEDVNERNEKMTEKVLVAIHKTISSWDSSKCPATNPALRGAGTHYGLTLGIFLLSLLYSQVV